jgi:hypothetical protein
MHKAIAGNPRAAMFVLAALLAALPVLLIPIPGFVDVPAHLARHHILAMAPSGGPLGRYFNVHWYWMANLGADIPSSILARWLGGELATRLVTAAIAPLTIAGLILLSRAAQGRVTASAALALPFVFSQPWMWGFLNYGLGLALALLVAAWVYAKPRERWTDAIALGAAGLIVWTAHMAAWVVLLLIVAGGELAQLRQVRDVWAALRRNWPLLLPVVPLVLWRTQSSDAGFTFEYFDYVHSKAAVFAEALRGTWKAVDLGLLAAAFAMSLVALLCAGRPRFEPRLLISGLLLTAGALAAPITLLNSWGTDVRTAPVALMLLVLSIRPARDSGRERLIYLAGAALFVAKLGSVALFWAERSPTLERRLALLEAVPRGGKLGYLYVLQTCDYPWQLVPDEKLASYAVARRDAFVNTLFMVDNARLVTMHDPHMQQRWSGGSQDVARRCPQGTIDPKPLRDGLAALRADSFDAIWVSGVDGRALPAVPGYRVAASLPGETMLVRER